MAPFSEGKTIQNYTNLSITPEHHARASRQSITPEHHARASRQSITPEHHARASRQSITPGRGGNATGRRYRPAFYAYSRRRLWSIGRFHPDFHPAATHSAPRITLP